MAQCLDHLHRTEAARDMYLRYAEAEPESEEMEQVQRRVRVLDEQLARPAPLEGDEVESSFLSVPALTGFSVAGAGLVTFVVAGAISKSRSNDLEETCAPLCEDGEVAPARRAALIADVALGVGIAGLVFGVVYGLVTGRERDESREDEAPGTLSVVPLRRGAAMRFEGSF